MNRRFLTLCVVSILFWQGNAFPSGDRRQEAAPGAAATGRQQTPPAPGDQYARMAEDFRPARAMLRRKGVPFEPALLLSSHWKEILAPKLATMPEMQTSRRLGGKIKGVQLADILYLPEKVELTGDTVILANQVVFEGRHAVIKGNYNVYFFPVFNEGVLGTTLESAMQRQRVRFERVGLKGTTALKRFVPRLLREGWSLTIDTSGKGRKEWLEEQRRKAQVGFVKTASQTVDDKSGADGATGATGNFGPPGSNADPSPSLPGDSGVCTSDPATGDGKSGFPGKPGGTGGQGEPGGTGGRGGDASTIIAQINTVSGTYAYYANGGEGGQGGKGGLGGPGGAGAVGGKGGDGANCTCTQGGAGDGGDGGLGGPGGKGGRGGKGGTGGLGGNGANITVKKPDNFAGTIYHSEWGGRGGIGGEPGDPGFPGSSASGGDKGRGASNTNCPSSTSKDGNPGQPQTNLGFGDYGSVGDSMQHLRGTDGEWSLLERGCTIHSTSGPYPPGECESPPEGVICRNNSVWSRTWCECVCNGSPIVIDVEGDGFDLTDIYNGVRFDIDGDGSPDTVSWTAEGADDAWLALDRDGNGSIDSSLELFGNFTPQPPSDEPNGFLALAVYDQAAQGGNGDGVIDAGDAVFASLRLWQDANHDGVSDAGELHTLGGLGLISVALDYKVSRRVDEHGNLFRYRAKVSDAKGAKVARWAWDVFLVRAP